MPIKTIAKFEVKYLQVLDEHNKLDKQLMPKISDSQMLDWYEDMVLARKFCDKMLALQRSGRMGTFAPVNGQEAAQVGSAAALKKDDWAVPSFREYAVLTHRGQDLTGMLLYAMGSEEGNMPPEDNEFNNFTTAIPVASQFLHATGLAWAANIKNEKKVVMVYGGDGSTSQGDFYEAMNFAGVFQLPIVFIIQNNQWAISIPRKHQTNAQTLAQKAFAAGLDCLQVDGNDVLAVYKASSEAVQNARKGKPQVLELITYRQSMHTTADDPHVYRTEKEEKQWLKKDPILRFRKFLEKEKLWDEGHETRLNKELDQHIAERIKEAQSLLNKDPKEMFKYMFSKTPKYIEEELNKFTPSKADTKKENPDSTKEEILEETKEKLEEKND